MNDFPNRIDPLGSSAIRPTAKLSAMIVFVLVSIGISMPGHADEVEDALSSVRQPKTLAERYCASINDRAADARFAYQSRQLGELTNKLSEKIKTLKERTVQFEEWLGKREAFLKLANDNLVQIYTSMRPDAASDQLVSVPESVAAAIIMKLEPRVASTILSEMDPQKAARLTASIAGATKLPDNKGGT